MIEELRDSWSWHNDDDYYISNALVEDRQDSNWYDDLVFSYDYKDFRFSVYAVGDVDIIYKDEHYSSLLKTDLKNDEELHKAIQNGELDWNYNNWYELFVDKYDEENGNFAPVDSFVIDNITDCLDKEWVENIVKGE